MADFHLVFVVMVVDMNKKGAAVCLVVSIQKEREIVEDVLHLVYAVHLIDAACLAVEILLVGTAGLVNLDFVGDLDVEVDWKILVDLNSGTGLDNTAYLDFDVDMVIDLVAVDNMVFEV